MAEPIGCQLAGSGGLTGALRHVGFGMLDEPAQRPQTLDQRPRVSRDPFQITPRRKEGQDENSGRRPGAARLRFSKELEDHPFWPQFSRSSVTELRLDATGADGWDVFGSLELELLKLGTDVATFRVKVGTQDDDSLHRLLVGAIKGHSGLATEVEEYGLNRPRAR